MRKSIETGKKRDGGEPIRILLVEDDPVDARVAEQALIREHPGTYSVTHVDSVRGALDALLKNGVSFDTILLDLNLPDSQGLQGFSAISQATGEKVPVVILSGVDDESIAVTAIHREAQDFVSKQNMSGSNLDRAIRYAIERHRTSQLLRLSRERFRQFARASSDRFWEMDENLCFVETSGTLDDGHYPSARDMVGKKPWELARVAPLSPGGWTDHEDDLLNRRPFRNFEIVTEDENGNRVFWSIGGEPIIEDEGPFKGYRGTSTNITKQKKAEEDLRNLAWELGAARDELEEMNAQKNRLFSIVAHDLRGPFNSLLGYSSLLENRIESLVPEGIKGAATALHEASNRVYALLENLLNWSRMQMGRIDFKPEPINLPEVVEESVRLFKSTAEDKGIALALDLNGTIEVFADRDMVGSILRNLITNAIKFTETGGSVSLRIATDGDSGLIEIADTGVGMSPDKVDQLFRLDVKTTTAGTAGESGTGLGLQICKEMAEKQGGRIEVESSESVGSTFRVFLPKRH